MRAAGALAALLVFSTALGAATINERYEAVMAAYQALKAEGRATSREEELHAELLAARRGRDIARLTELVGRAEEMYAVGANFSDAVVIQLAPDGGEIRGPSDSFPLSAGILLEERDILLRDPDLLDDMAVYRILSSDTPPVFLAPLAPPETSAAPPRLIPPRGWAWMNQVSERWRKIAVIAETGTMVTTAAVETRRADFAEWMYAETVRRPRHALCVIGDDPDRLEPFLSLADAWIVKPGWEPRGSSLKEILRLLARLRAPQVQLVLPSAMPWVEILKRGFSEMPAARMLLFRHSGFFAYASGSRFIAGNHSAEPVRVNFLAIAAPRMRTFAETDRAATTRARGRATILREDGIAIEEQDFDSARRTGLVLPGGSLAFVEIAFEESAR